MVVALIVVLLLMAFVAVLIWSASLIAPHARRERMVISAVALFVMLPPLALAVGAVT